MATQAAKSLGYQVPMAGEYGNLAVAIATITLAAATNGDLFRFLKLPADVRLIDLQVVNSASSAGTTMKFGYEHVDGEAGDDDDYFAAAKSLATASRIRADAANAPKLVDREVYITGVLGGANIATETTITVVAIYEFVGHA